MIACFLSDISAKYYKNPSMLSRVIAKNVGDVFLRHSVVTTWIFQDEGRFGHLWWSWGARWPMGSTSSMVFRMAICVL